MIDWSFITNNIRARYKPLQQVAAEVGCDERHLNRLARGEINRPRDFMLELTLLDLHYDHCPEQHKRITL